MVAHNLIVETPAWRVNREAAGAFVSRTRQRCIACAAVDSILVDMQVGSATLGDQKCGIIGSAKEARMEVRAARLEEVATYAEFGRAAQVWLRSRGLGQYVPTAHDEYAAAIRARVAAGTLYVVAAGGAPIGFFSLDPVPSSWWPADGEPAMYLAGMVAAQQARRRGVGGHIIRWCVAEARRRGCRFVRLDCHAGNPWLCRYYEGYGFELRGRVEQHPGYDGCLYQLSVAIGEGTSEGGG
jgi:GNAT superfamily N-acetyltransferase